MAANALSWISDFGFLSDFGIRYFGFVTGAALVSQLQRYQLGSSDPVSLGFSGAPLTEAAWLKRSCFQRL